MKTNQLHINEWIFVPVVAVVVVAIGFFMSQIQTHSSKDVSDINYQMPRPQDDLIGEYSLDGRQVHRQYINPFTQTKAPQVIPVAKNNKLKAATKKSNQKKPKSNKAKGLLNDKKFDVDVVEKTQNDLNAEIQALNSQKRMNQQVLPQNQQTKNQTKNPVSVQSVSQWMELLNKNPSAENIVSLVKAYRQKKIDSASFYQITKALLSSDQMNKVQAGLYALQLQPEQQAFQFVSRQLAILDPQADLAKSLEQYLISFNHAQGLPILAQVLKSKDQIAVTKAIEVLSQFSDKTILQGRFQSRGTVVNQQHYVQLMSYFQALLNSENESVVSTAQNMLTKLQALVDSATIGS